MQNREELRQKDHDGRRKTMCQERGKNIIFRRVMGGNRNIDPRNGLDLQHWCKEQTGLDG